MFIIILLLLAFSVSIDAFAISICLGMVNKNKFNISPPIWFTTFQIIMFIIGSYIAVYAEKYIVAFDHWIAFVFLFIIGINMIKEKEEYEIKTNILSLLFLSVATSIDSLTVGFSFVLAYSRDYILMETLLIGIITFIMCLIGIKVGNIYKNIDSKKSKIIGGIILIIIGIKILIEHLI